LGGEEAGGCGCCGGDGGGEGGWDQKRLQVATLLTVKNNLASLQLEDKKMRDTVREEQHIESLVRTLSINFAFTRQSLKPLEKASLLLL